MALDDVCHLEGSNINLHSISRILKLGWDMSAPKESIVMKKGALKICFDIIILTKHGELYCAYFTFTDEVQGGALTNGVQMIIMKTHAIFGRGNELATRKAAKYIG